jgi:hypothetical protein
MNPNTGAIAYFETDEDAERAGHTVKLSKKEASGLIGLNRHERRAELARMRKAAKQARRSQRG